MGLAKSAAEQMVETSDLVSVVGLVKVFSDMLDRAIAPLAKDIQQLRNALAGPLSKMYVQNQLDQRVSRLEEITRQHQELLREIRTVMKILKYLGTALGTSILALLWGLITGRVQLLFP